MPPTPTATIEELNKELQHMQQCFNLSRAELPPWVHKPEVTLENLPYIIKLMTEHAKTAAITNNALAAKLVECRKMLIEQQKQLDARLLDWDSGN